MLTQDLIDIINARLEYAKDKHGPFQHSEHVIDALELEINEAVYANAYQTEDAFAEELMDCAIICLRAIIQEQYAFNEYGGLTLFGNKLGELE